MRNPEEIDPDWARYPETVVRFEGDEKVQIDLRELVTVESRDALRAMDLSAPFAILTAHNPRGEDAPPADNARRQAELEAVVAGAGFRFVRVDCCSPDGEHCECSLVIVCEQAVAVDLAKRFDQVAIFWWDGAAFWIVGGTVIADPVMLPRSS